MWLYRYFGIAYLIVFFLQSSPVLAAAPNIYNGKMNGAVAGVVQKKVGKWGFAANDPRVNATFIGIGSGLTSVAVAVGTGAVATVGWPVILVGAGIAAVVGGGIAWAQDSIMNWIFNSDGSITTTGNTSTTVDPNGKYVPLNAIDALDCVESQAVDWCDTSNGINISYCKPRSQYYNPTIACRSDWANFGFYRRATSVPDAFLVAGYVKAGITKDNNVKNASVKEAVEKISSEEASKPLSNEMLAAAANAAWKAMAVNTGGLPWSSSDPITPADVADWVEANPGLRPSVADALAPVSSGSAVVINPNQIVNPGSNPGSGPVATPGTGVEVDLGPNPNIAAPILEPTPTAQQIIGPILNLMPDLKSFVVPSHSAICPRPNFTVFDRTYTIESHCGLIDGMRSVIDAAMLLVWTIGAMFIILRA